MLEFNKDFFLGETRNDFYIEPMMKCAWAAELEVLEVVRHICEKHSIPYFAAYGTMLGAVRHGGFIPWDDDIDIMMFRDDYNRFLSLAPAELTGEYQLHSPYSTPDHKTTFARINNASSVSYSTRRLTAFHGFPYVAGVDIMPLDVLPGDPGERNVFFQLYNIIVSSFLKYRDGDIEEILSILPDLEEIGHIQIDRNGDIYHQLLLLAERLSQSYNTCESPYVSCVAYAAPKNRVLLREWYASSIPMPFENIQIPVPVGYDSILTVLYGDYITPTQSAAAHNYPFYKQQNNEIVQKISEFIMRGKAPLDEEN